MQKTVFVYIFAVLALTTSSAHAATKGMSLYTWREADGSIAYSIVKNSDETKKLEAITKEKAPLGEIERKLMGYKMGTKITWNNLNETEVKPEMKPRFTLPDATAYNRIREAAARAKLRVTIAQ